MFLDLTGSQAALRDELREYFSNLISPAEREVLLTERHGDVHREVVRRMGRDGWLGVGWPAEYGGRGLGQVEQQIFANEAARARRTRPASPRRATRRGPSGAPPRDGRRRAAR